MHMQTFTGACITFQMYRPNATRPCAAPSRAFSACATSAHCIGAAAEQIQLGKQDLIFAGGGEEEDWTLTSLFDAMGVVPSRLSVTPRAGAPGLSAELA